MEQLLLKLNKQKDAKLYIKMTDLDIGKTYAIISLNAIVTTFGPAVVARLNSDQQLILPRLKMSQEECETYNLNTEENFNLIYHGKMGKAYNYDIKK